MKNTIKIFMFLAVWAFAFSSCDDDENLDITLGFSYTPEENIEVDDTVYFTNNSISNMDVVYEWDFGDGTSSTEESPKHVYSEPGIYDVTLGVSEGQSLKYVSMQVDVDADLAYIINYGSFTGGKSTISAFDKYADEVNNGYYKSINGVAKVSNIQYSYSYKGNIYFMDNNVDGLSWVDAKTFEQTNNAISTDINKPRYCVANGDYLYVSCWESDAIFNGDHEISYIAKVDLNSNQVIGKISVHGGPEGLEIVNNKLYAALTFKNNIAVIDLNTETVSYIETPARTTNFRKDNENNLYVTLTRDWDDYVTQTGIGYFNTTTDNLDAVYNLDGVGTSYDNVMAPNADFSKLYVMSSGYDANWNVSGNISVFNVATKSFESTNLVEGVSAINGVDFYDSKVFCFISETVTGGGKAVTYNEDGTKIKEYDTGIAPFMILSVK